MAGASTLMERVDAILALALKVYRQETERSLALCRQAYAFATAEGGYPKGAAESQRVEGVCHLFTGNIAEALTRGLASLAAYETIDDPSGIDFFLYLLGVIYTDLGDLPAALEYHHQKLALLEQIGDPMRLGRGLLSIGFVHSDLAEHAQAIAFYHKALDLLRQADDLQGVARTLNSCCVDYGLLGEYAQALEFGRQSLSIFERIGDVYGQGVVFSSIGEVHSAAQDYEQALHAYSQALDLMRQQSGDLRSSEAVATLYNIGYARLKQGDCEAAQAYLEQARDLAAEANHARLLYQCWQGLSEVYAARGDYHRALEAYQQFHSVKESVFNETSNLTLRNLEVRYGTQQALAEMERLKQMHEEDQRYYESLNQLQQELIGAASHDLRSPLNSIMLALELLERRASLTDKELRYLGIIRSSAEQMLKLVQDLLELAKLQTGIALQVIPVPVESFLSDSLVQHATAANRKEISTQFESHLGDLVAKFDAHQIHRVLDNLLSNAIKYTLQGGHITLAAWLEDNSLVVKVSDTGLGIPAEDLPHIFQRFYRVQQTSHLMQEGSGMGLAIASAIIEQHGGRMWAESQVGQGSDFYFTLPLEAAALADNSLQPI